MPAGYRIKLTAWRSPLPHNIIQQLIYICMYVLVLGMGVFAMIWILKMYASVQQSGSHVVDVNVQWVLT